MPVTRIDCRSGHPRRHSQARPCDLVKVGKREWFALARQAALLAIHARERAD
jgi:hypothetical protein